MTHCLVCGSERPDAPDPVRPPPKARRGYLLGSASWAYLGGVAVLLIALRGLGDRWWPATMLLYAPRWPYALPLLVLVPAGLLRRGRSLIPLALASALMIGPVLGFRVPWRHFLRRTPSGTRLRVVTCNVQSGRWNPALLERLVAREDPDILMIQEWADVPGAPASWSSGRYTRRDGGFYVSSRYPIRGMGVLADPVWSWRKLAVRYDVETPNGLLHVFNVHLETPRKGIEPVLRGGIGRSGELVLNTAFREVESGRVARWVGEAPGRVLIGGDFNMPSDSTIFARHWSPYVDAFEAAGLGFGYTKFTRWHGARIDHLLTDRGLGIVQCRVGLDVDSDHRPLIATFIEAGEPPEG